MLYLKRRLLLNLRLRYIFRLSTTILGISQLEIPDLTERHLRIPAEVSNSVAFVHAPGAHISATLT